MISNSRGPETLAELEQSLGQNAQAGTVEEAAEFGEVVIVAVPLAAVETLPAGLIAGRVVIDANNYYPSRDGQIGELDRGEIGSSELLPRSLPGARVVKAFNTCGRSGSCTRPVRRVRRSGWRHPSRAALGH
jgi:predicted dinucleotide-binding enzyme